jgi:uncharacterized protein YuzE
LDDQTLRREIGVETMKITYDPEADAACIYLAPFKPGLSKEAVPLLPEQTGGRFINLDFGADGKLVSIEILDASKVLPEAVLKSASRPGLRS